LDEEVLVMAKRLDVLEAELQRLKDIAASGIDWARFQSREVHYRPYPDLQEAIADKQREIDAEKGLGLRNRRRGTVAYPRLGY
jgi:hypothetical protein